MYETVTVVFDATKATIKDSCSGFVSVECEVDIRDTENIISQLDFEIVKSFVLSQL